MMTETEQRAAVVTEARTWLGTPWAHAGDVKGRKGGVDCGMLLIRSFKDSGVCPDIADPRPYARYWFLHQDTDTYLAFLGRYAKAITLPENGTLQPGDIVAFKMPKWKTFGHAGIVTVWPKIIHSYYQESVVTESNIMQPSPFSEAERAYFSVWSA